MTSRQEIWYQDSLEQDLWVGESGLLVNTAALDERASCFEVAELVRVPAQPVLASNQESVDKHNL